MTAQEGSSADNLEFSCHHSIRQAIPQSFVDVRAAVVPESAMRWLVLLSAVVLLGASSVRANDRDPAKEKFFEAQVRPLLVAKCVKCHGDAKQKGGLRLDTRDGFLDGGESGAVVAPGDPKKSLLIEAINFESLEMPPDGKLSADEILILTKWVSDGAYWPSEGTVLGKSRGGKGISDEDKKWWAFQPIRRPDVPKLADDAWSRGDIDRFLLAKMKAAQLSPAPEADKVTLIRRVTFDLTGLPPTNDEITAFVNDDSPHAYEQLVDRLLASERYGERAARQWFDLIRYNESDGYRKDDYRPDMWRYRDYVIRSLNADKPLNQFIAEQIAGDELDPNNPDALIATGYWRLYLYEYNQRDARTHWQAILDELTDVTGEVFLGFSIGCAKCHDHKFDPILRADYFRLQAYFTSIFPEDETPVVAREQLAEHRRKQAEWEQATAAIREEIERIKKPYVARARASAVSKFPPDIRGIVDKQPTDRSAYERQLMDLMNRQIYLEVDKPKLKDDDKKRVDELTAQLAQFEALKPGTLPVAMTVRDASAVPAITVMTGDRKARDVLPGILSVFNPAPAEIPPLKSGVESTGRRAALANWLTSTANPLTPRVMANRLWQTHFGIGLVATSSDFGHLGEAPSHPELLDWLTSTLLENNGSFKTLHRLIVLSSAYRQSSRHPQMEAGLRVDPLNRLRWKWDVRRLDAEQIRDAILASSGELDLKSGGPSVDAKSTRRSIFTKQMRNSPDPFLDSFDAADGFNSTAKRNVTTTPTQSLLMVNGAWPLSRAQALAKQVEARIGKRSPGTDPLAEAVRGAWQATYGRLPNDTELTNGIDFLKAATSGNSKPSESQPEALTAKFAATNSNAALFTSGSNGPQWKLGGDGKNFQPAGDFTIEATVLLKSIYADANVRTIVSQWDGAPTTSGWNLGVTSAKSKHEPRHLILQLTGQAASEPGSLANAATNKPSYVVIPSGLKLELNKAYSVAVAIKFARDGKGEATFFVRELSNDKAELKTAVVAHQIQSLDAKALQVVIGDRDGTARSRWDGLIDDVRLTSGLLSADQLNGKSDPATRFAHWSFGSESTPGQDSSAKARHLTVHHATEAPSKSGLSLAALADLCHALLNSNEFLYVD